MPHMIGEFKRPRITICLDFELLALLRTLSQTTGMSVSMQIEQLVLCGLRSRGQKLVEDEGIKCH